MLLLSLARLTVDSSVLAETIELVGLINDWQATLNGIEINALAPLVHRDVEAYELPVPASIKLGLKALALRHSAATNARYALITDLIREFSAANIPLIALKGLSLAPMIYPADNLRPMRDIDVLVPAGQQEEAGRLLRKLGFDLPESQPSRFMRDSHQLPNATKSVNGFVISVEIHHDALSRDVPGHLFYNDIKTELQTVKWRDLEITTLGHEHMLHQVARHLSGLHPGAVLKLINVLDVVLYAEKFRLEIDWARMHKDYSHVINTLKCLHQIVPLSSELQQSIGGVTPATVKGIGETMQPFVMINRSGNSLLGKARMLFLPPDWWLHLYYNVSPEKSLITTKLIRHPARITTWLAKRLYSGLLGG